MVEDKKLPKGWEWKKLGEVCDVRDGTHDSPKYVNEGYPLVTSKNLNKGYIDFSDCSLITKEDLDKINKRSLVEDGDIIMPMIGTIGNPLVVKKDRPFAIKNVALIKFKDSNLINQYVRYLLSGPFFEDAISKTKRGGTQKFISLGDIRNLVIPVPPVHTQKKIVEIIENAERLKQRRIAINKETGDILHSYFCKIFKDIDKYDKVKMSEVTEWITQGPNPNLNKEPSNNNFGFIKTKDVYNDAIYYAAINSLNEEEYEKFKKYTLKEGDVLLAIVGFGSIGKVNIFKEVVKRKIIPTRALALIRCKTERILPEYVKGYLLSSEGKKIIENWTGGSTGQLVVKTSVIKNYLIPLPSIIQQKKFKEVLLDIENIKKRQGTSTQEINNLFDALIQKAFKGELIR